MKLKILDLFSGIGGFSLGLESTGHFETAAFCEIEPYCQKVLKKHWPDVPIFDDIRKLKGKDIGAIDIITGGYPCQPFSVAGKQKAEQDPRHLWPEYFRLIKELRPTWVIGENVSGHIKLGLDTVLEDLASEGYSTRTFSISASSIGANHKRERIWIIANSNGSKFLEENSSVRSEGTESIRSNIGSICENISKTNDVANSDKMQRQFLCGQESEQTQTTFERSSERSGASNHVADTNSERQQEQWWPISVERQRKKGQELKCESWWEFEPRVGRVAHGIPKRVDRLKTLGNSVVPHIPYYIGQAIVESYQ